MKDNEVFRLGTYAHETLTPLIKKAQEIDPTIRLSIELRFENLDTEFGDGRVSVFAHWDREEGMFIYSTWNTSNSDIDGLAAQVRGNLSELRPAQP